MRSPAVVTLMFAGLLAAPFMAAGENAVSAAPRFSLKTVSGETVSLEQCLGRGPVVVNFWATWCGPCILEMKNLKKTYAKYAPSGMQMLSISVDDNKTQPQIPGTVRSYQFPYTVLLDENKDAYNAFHVANVPHLFILDARGGIVYSHQGYRKGDEKKVEAVVANLIKGAKQP
jgi:peroxiredoxin